MEMTDENIRQRLKGVADEIKVEDCLINRQSNSSENDQNLLKKSNYSKKIGTPFRQQKLFAWQPILTASTVLPWLLAFGIIFIPVGIILLNTSNRIEEINIYYDDCIDSATNKTCESIIENNLGSSCSCEKNFQIKNSIDKSVFFYYALENYFQNHRRYVRSRNDWQLLGYTNLNQLTSCLPFSSAIDPETNKNMLIAPCGAIANSIFNDTFKLFYETNIQVPLLENDISWPTDRKYKFKNPSSLDELKKFTHPKNWKIYLQDFTSANKSAFENEHLIVWMRSAALPNFKKLFARVDHSLEQFKFGLPKGNYKILINYNYPVRQFNGKKSFILSNTSWLGGKNSFLGYAYIVTGILCICVVGILFIIYKKYGLREHDMIRIDASTPFVFE